MLFESIRQSIINTWDLCPERVRRRWVLGDIIPPGIAAKIGTGVHKGAEINHKQKINTREDAPEDVICDAARDAYIESVQAGVFFPPEEKGSAKKQLSNGIDITVNLAKLYRRELAPRIFPVMVEKWIKTHHDLVPIPFTGTLDVYTEDDWLPDFKTAAKKWPQSRADASPQATIYNELILEETGKYPNLLTFEVLVKKKEPEIQEVITKRTRSDFDALAIRVGAMIESIQAGIFPPAQIGHWTCSPRYCGYYWTCKYIPEHKKNTK